MGAFNIAKIIHKASCPICNGKLTDVMNIGLSRCKYSIEGRSETGEEILRENLLAPTDGLLTF